ncbi:hypothetical protein [Acidithiobacillus sp.]|jgi:hypothetical protein
MARKAQKNDQIKPWAITWVLAILAMRGDFLASPELSGSGSPFWIPIGLETLRFTVLWFTAHVIVHIIFGAWDMFAEGREL